MQALSTAGLMCSTFWLWAVPSDVDTREGTGATGGANDNDWGLSGAKLSRKMSGVVASVDDVADVGVGARCGAD